MEDESLWTVSLSIIVCAVAGWTGLADGQFCESPIDCITYLPVSAIGGLLFALPAFVVSAVAIVFLNRGLKMRLTVRSVSVLAICLGIAGFILGRMPGLHGVGP